MHKTSETVLTATGTTAKTDPSEVCLNSFIQHWAEAQIDGPMQVIARYDDIAKLLITIGGFLLAILAASYSVMIRDLRQDMNVSQIRIQSVVIFVAMLVFFICTAAVCFQQPKMRADEIMKLRKDNELISYIDDWCSNLGRVILAKRVLLCCSTVSFIVAFLAMTYLL